MGDITLRDLHDMRTAITSDMRHEVARAETAINERIDDVKHTQEDHGRELGEHRREIGELRTVIRERTAPLGVLTPRQKKALWAAAAAVGGACLEGLRHVAGWLLTWASAHGVPHP